MKTSLVGPLLAGLVLAFAVGHVAYLFFLCDDAFITFRYAQHLVAGDGIVFNLGERVEGYTSFLWVWVCAGILAAGGRPEAWTPWLSGAISLVSLGILMRRHDHPDGRHLLFGLLTAACGGWAAWATGGLETALFTALVSLAYSCLATELDPPRARPGGTATIRRGAVLAAGGLLAAATLTRPEGALVAVLFGGFLAVQVRRGRLDGGTLLRGAVLWLLPTVAFVLWRYSYYGDIVPNTAHVKAEGLAMLPQGLQYLLVAGKRLHLYLIPVPFLLLAARRPERLWRSERTWLAATVVLPFLAYVAAVGGDFMDMFRFVVPVLPIVFLATAEALGTLVTTPPPTRRRFPIAIAALGLLAYTALNLATSHDSRKLWYRHRMDSIGLLDQYVQDWTAVGKFLKELSQPSDTLATTAAGCIPYYSGLYTIDQHGLVAPDLDHYVRRENHGPGHSLLIKGEHLLELRPHFLLGGAKIPLEKGQVLLGLYIENGWEEAFEPHYRTLSITRPEFEGRLLTFALRRDVLARRKSDGP